MREKERERERVSTSRGGAKREGERESQAGSALSEPDMVPNSGTIEIMTGAEIKNQMLNQLRHPGAPNNLESEQVIQRCRQHVPR